MKWATSLSVSKSTRYFLKPPTKRAKISSGSPSPSPPPRKTRRKPKASFVTSVYHCRNNWCYSIRHEILGAIYGADGGDAVGYRCPFSAAPYGGALEQFHCARRAFCRRIDRPADTGDGFRHAQKALVA